MKIPRSYYAAAHILKQMNAKKGSLNSLISDANNKNQNIKLIYALVIKTIQNLNAIEKMVQMMNEEDGGSDGQDLDSNPFLTQILVADLIYGKHLQGLRDASSVQHLIKYEDKFKELVNSKTEANESDNQTIVRYIRVNLIKTNLKRMISKFLNNGFKKIDYEKTITTFDMFKELVIDLKEDEFLVDYHFQEDLLVFNINATKRLQQMKSFKESKIVMQDKASLIPVECLQLASGMTIMDVCCAPGMKTTAIASRVRNNATILAFDRSQDRIEQMHKFVAQNGVNCCQINCVDFTDVSCDQIQTPDAILLDPSCSGSGMNKRVDYKKDRDNTPRINKLASFQTRMLSHAMSFGAKRLVYSTCSLSVMENENVVKSALQESQFGSDYSIVNAFPDWPIRGVGDFEFASKCIRSDAQSSLTNGFFVCVLEQINRKRNSEKDFNIEPKCEPKKKKKRLSNN